ncbi:MAG: methionyl-tRNA formyltransferase [Kiritimatiellae bacterium]|nr:methionyl-tRNA formyltransferase [Kiritimatiellia bacterium]
MRILFMGSDELACPALEKLLGHGKDQVVGIITQPDRPKGRHRKLTACPVKEFAEGKGLSVFTPEKIEVAESVMRISEWKPEVIVVAAYGQYIPSKVLDLPMHGAINIHPSMLPKYRGASPIQWAIANGDKITGVTILYVTKEMDAGDIIIQREVCIDDDDTFITLKPYLALVGAELLGKALDEIRDGKATRTPQNHEASVYVPKLTKEDGRIDWTQEAEVIRNRMRGFYPWPGCYCEIASAISSPLKVLSVRIEEGVGEPGYLIDVQGDGPLMATGQHALRLLEVQPSGKKRMTGSAYLCGYDLKVGNRL